MKVVGVLSTHKKEELLFAIYILNNYSELDIAAKFNNFFI